MLSNLYPPVVSGSSTQSSSLARELARRGCEVVVVTARVDDDLPEVEEEGGVSVHRLSAKRLPKLPIAMNFPWLSYTFTPGNLRRLAAILGRHPPGVLHLHNHMFDLAFSAVVLRRRFRIPLAVTIHTVIKHVRSAYNLLLYPADRVLLRRVVVDRADAVISPDVNIQEYVREAFGGRSSVLVPYGISVPSPTPAEVEKVRARYGLGGKRVILSLGHVHELRNRKDLVEALPAVRKAVPNAVLVIAGAVSTEMPRVIARDLGVESSMILTGPVAHSDVPALLALADMEVHWANQEPAEKTSLGIATLEAMAAGKVAVVAANLDTHGPGVLTNGENIVLVERGKPMEIASTLIELLADDEKRRAIGERARRTIENHFSWDAVCAGTLKIYEEMIRRSAHEGAKV